MGTRRPEKRVEKGHPGWNFLEIFLASRTARGRPPDAGFKKCLLLFVRPCGTLVLAGEKTLRHLTTLRSLHGRVGPIHLSPRHPTQRLSKEKQYAGFTSSPENEDICFKFDIHATLRLRWNPARLVLRFARRRTVGLLFVLQADAPQKEGP
jgi:hypothetical protein